MRKFFVVVQVPICVLCLYDNHEGHAARPLNQVFDTEYAKLQQKQEQLRSVLVTISEAILVGTVSMFYVEWNSIDWKDLV